MDKYEYKVRAEEIKSLIADGEYAEAAKIADTIDWRRVRSVMMLCTISDLYKINRRYEDSRDILLLAYEKGGGRRPIVYSLCELSIKLEEYVQAIEYYKEFVQLAPKDSGRYILQYKLYEAQEVSLEERIAVLEELKKKDYREKWAYELAYLYHRVGLESKCVEECDEMFLWFSDGRYVLKALELKKLHQPLTEEQEAKYEQMKHTGGIIEADIVTEGKAIQEEAGQAAAEEEEDDEFSREQNVLTDPTQELPGKSLDEIEVKTVDVSQYNTINLQKELAESMKEFLGVSSHAEERENAVQKETQDVEEEAEAAEAADMAEAADIHEVTASEMPAEELPAASGPETPAAVKQDTDEMQLISEDMLTDSDSEAADPVSEEVFFGNTSEVKVEDVISELVEKDAQTSRNIAAMQESVSKVADRAESLQKDRERLPEASPNPAISNTGVIRTFHKPSGFDDILSQEYDGQISLAIPEEEQIEKQITGQLSIDDVMAEWEKMKKDNEQKMLQEIKERVHKQTDSLFSDFDEATKTGLLEELEKAMVDAAVRESKKRAEAERPKVVKVSDIDAKEEEKAEEQPEEQSEKQPEEQTEKQPEVIEDAEIIEEETGEADTSLDEEIPAEEVPEKEIAEEEAAEEKIEEEKIEEEKTEEEKTKEEGTAEAGNSYTAREMSRSEREQFAPFIHHKKTRKQIVEVIDNISLASYTGNVVITGEEGTGTTALAKLLVKEVQLSDNNFSGKVAKISGGNMNKKEVGATLDRLLGGALIIEGAASMKKNTVESLIRELNQEGKGLIIILEDKKEAIEKFLTKYPALATIFNLRVDVEALDDQTLVKYARKYALEQEYAIDELGVLALHTRIADMQTSDHEVTLSEIEEIVDEAIYYADKKTPKHFFDVLFGKRYDDEDMVVLREKDFMHY
ncbi:MAG: tetratricopeptide repeat protein [Suilimivivens sp.]